jgi:hypothetical protein
MSRDFATGMREIEVKLLSEENPKRASFSGNNAFYHHCDIYQGQANYAVCLHTIAAVAGKRVTLASNCQEAIEKRTCPAIQMRAKENEVGRALFFIDRVKMEQERDALIRETHVGLDIRYGKPRTSPSSLKGKWVEDKMDFSHIEKSAQDNTSPKSIGDIEVGQDALTSAINRTLEVSSGESRGI